MGTVRLDDVSFLYDDELLGSKRHRRDVKDIPEEKLVLKHLDLTIEDGQFVCLVGHSGCGKSTMLRLLAGLQSPTEGSISIDDTTVEGSGLDRSVVFQNYSLFPWMTVRKNVEFGIRQASQELGRRLSKQDISDIASTYLGKVNMSKAEGFYPYQLSGGMQQRVAIARALAMDTEILLFDEPFGALDVKTRRELQALMENLWVSGKVRKTAVFVTHDIEEALLLADRVLFMSAGRFKDEFLVGASRPREVDSYVKTPEYATMRRRLVDLFYQAEETSMDQADRERVYDGGSTL